VQAVFERGERLPEAGEREVERLYMEADGVHVRLQGQPQSHLEVRSAIAYEGWNAWLVHKKRIGCVGNGCIATPVSRCLSGKVLVWPGHVSGSELCSRSDYWWRRSRLDSSWQ